MNFNKTVGLQNFGNTCFMNASLQLLISCQNFISILVSDFHIKNNDLYKYIQTFIDYYNHDTKILGPLILYKRYINLNNNYLGFTQEDAHEFLTFTIDDILTLFELYIKNQSSEDQQLIISKLNINNIDTNNDNIIQILLKQFFSIKIEQIVTYRNNSEPSKTIVYEHIISLGIENCSTLEDCLNKFRTVEDDFNIDFKLLDMPKNLFISLKRFKMNNDRIEKNNNEIEIPLLLKLGHIYQLKGFIMHIGNMFGGHYYSYCSRLIDDNIIWFCFNDTNVSRVSLDQINNELKHAYILLYECI